VDICVLGFMAHYVATRPIYVRFPLGHYNILYFDAHSTFSEEFNFSKGIHCLINRDYGRWSMLAL
jgi:hypothetical protein